MIDTIMAAVNYIGCALLVYGIWRIGKKERSAFIFTFFAELSILSYSLYLWAKGTAGSGALILLGVILASLQVKNYIEWGKTDGQEKQSQS